MFGIQDDYMNLLISICATNGLAIRMDIDGILVFRDNEEHFIFEKNIGTLIGKLLYTNVGLDVDYLLSIEELKLIDDEAYQEVFEEYRNNITQQFIDGTHPFIEEAQQVANSIGRVGGIEFDVFDGKITIPDNLLVIKHEKDGEPVHKVFAPHELKGQALLSWFAQKDFENQINKGIVDFDEILTKNFYGWFSQKGIIEYMTKNTIDDTVPMPSLEDICESAMQDIQLAITLERTFLTTEESFISHCERNDVFFNVDGVIVNGWV